MIVYLNDYGIYSDETTATSVSTDLTIYKGDTIEIKASNSSGGAWEIDSVTIGYDIKWAIDNESIIKV